MALNKTDSAKLQALQDNVSLLIKVANLAPEAAFAGIAEKAAEFEAQTEHKILLLGAADADGNWLSVVDLRRDFLRLRQVGDGYTVLKSRALGVSVEVKVARTGAYEHANLRLAEALEKLAASIRLQPALSTLGESDLAFVPGEAVGVAEDDEELADAANAAEEPRYIVPLELEVYDGNEAKPAPEVAHEAASDAKPATAAPRSLFAEGRQHPF